MKRFTSLSGNTTHSLQCASHTCSNLQWRQVLQQPALCFWFQTCSFPTCVILVICRIFIQSGLHIWKAFLRSWIFSIFRRVCQSLLSVLLTRVFFSLTTLQSAHYCITRSLDVSCACDKLGSLPSSLGVFHPLPSLILVKRFTSLLKNNI